MTARALRLGLFAALLALVACDFRPVWHPPASDNVAGEDASPGGLDSGTQSPSDGGGFDDNCPPTGTLPDGAACTPSASPDASADTMPGTDASPPDATPPDDATDAAADDAADAPADDAPIADDVAAPTDG